MKNFLRSKNSHKQSAWRWMLGILFVLAAIGVTPKPAQAAVAADNGSHVMWETWKDSRTLDLAVTSPSIDGPVKSVRLLLPNGWSKTSTKSWPTLWLLHGGTDDYTSWTKNTDIASLSAGHDAIIVMADTSWCSAYSNWWNYGKYGAPAWENYMTQDLPQILERGYRANSNRTIAGPSMGGLGALKLPANHPGMYSGAASFSGNADPLHSYNNTADGPDLPGLGCGADWKRVWGDYRIPEQKAIWQQNDPYDQAAGLSSLNYLYLASGDGLSSPLGVGMVPDPVEKQVNAETHALADKLQTLSIPATTHFYSGTHSWPYWQQELHSAFPGLLSSMNVQ